MYAKKKRLQAGNMTEIFKNVMSQIYLAASD